mgnify:FL=1
MIRAILFAIACVSICLFINHANVTQSFGFALRSGPLYGLMALVCAGFGAAWWATRGAP